MKNQELTLLHIFDVVMTERSVTRAAEQLATTQPAVSNAISRMRSSWNDQIFFKKGKNIEPTLFACNLWSKIHGPIQNLSDAINTTQFDPLHNKRQFRVALTDLSVDLVWLPLLSYASEFAPNIDFYAVPYNKAINFEQLKSGQIDFVFGPELDPDPSFKSVQLYEDEILLAMSKNHQLSQRMSVTLEDLTKARILQINSDDGVSTSVNDCLDSKISSKGMSSAVNNYTSAIKVLQQSNLVSSVPASFYGINKNSEELFFARHPMNEIKMRNVLTWHIRSQMDGGFQWFKDVFIKLALDAHKQSIQEINYKIEHASSRKMSA